MSLKDKGEMPFHAVGDILVIENFAAQLFQGIQQGSHGPPAHLGRGIQPIPALGKSQIGRQEPGGGSGAAYVDIRFLPGQNAPQTFHGYGAAFLLHMGFKAQLLDAVKKMSGIIGEEHAPEGGDALGQGGQQKGPVGDALGAGDAYRKGADGRKRTLLSRIV